MTEIECPYCGADCGVPDEPGGEGEELEWQCSECKKYFMFIPPYMITYDSHKAPCLNGGKHKWEKMVGSPKEFFEGKYRCKYYPEAKTIKPDEKIEV